MPEADLAPNGGSEQTLVEEGMYQGEGRRSLRQLARTLLLVWMGMLWQHLMRHCHRTELFKSETPPCGHVHHQDNQLGANSPYLSSTQQSSGPRARCPPRGISGCSWSNTKTSASISPALLSDLKPHLSQWDEAGDPADVCFCVR